jgi:uncharacterized protein YjeT (DUF2065 family)
MSDLLVGIGLVLVIEGVLWAMFPAFGLRMLTLAAEMPEGQLRLAGAVAVIAGVGVVWMARG